MISLVGRQHAGSYCYIDTKTGEKYVVEKIDDIRGPSYAYWWWRLACKGPGETSYGTKREAVEALQDWVK